MRRPILPSLVAATLLLAAAPAVAQKTVDRIAFGSCAKQFKPQPIWDTIAAADPDVFLFIGDNVYADTENMKKMQATYDELAAKPEFARFRKKVPILAMWDDHDYGANDAGKEYPKKEEAKQVFLDFFGEPTESPRRLRPGVYDAKTYGKKGQRVQIILLDTRWFRDALRPAPRAKKATGRPGPYLPIDTGTILGEDQWAWLESELRKPAELRVIVSGIQFVSKDHRWEQWGNHPHERQRMLDTLKRTGAGGVVFVSGDRHRAELSRLSAAESGLGYVLLDLTSSSLNHPLGWRNEINQHRWGSVYAEANFGTIEVDWTQADPTVSLQIRGLGGDAVIVYDTTLSALHP